jgi:hypothetical protein
MGVEMELDTKALDAAAEAVYGANIFVPHNMADMKTARTLATVAVQAYEAACRAPNTCANTPLVYSRPECPFNYCDAPELCQPGEKCRHEQ